MRVRKNRLRRLLSRTNGDIGEVDFDDGQCKCEEEGRGKSGVGGNVLQVLRLLYTKRRRRKKLETTCTYRHHESGMRPRQKFPSAPLVTLVS